MEFESAEDKAEKIKRWGKKWTTIRDNAALPETRAYAEKYLEFLRGQLRKLIAAKQGRFSTGNAPIAPPAE